MALMTYFSEKYGAKDNLWFENFCFERWFKDAEPPILDIGCAAGNFVAVHPAAIEGIDIDKDSLAIAEKRGLKTRYLDANNNLNQLPEEFYGGIYAKQIIEHLDDPLKFMIEVRRVLKKGGKAVIL